MSRSEYERAWGTAGWLEDHEFGTAAGIVRCQRRTKTYEDVATAVQARPGVRISAVYRQKRDDGYMCAAFLWGEASGSQQPVFSVLNLATRSLEKERKAEFACVSSFAYDYPAGLWKALVVFKRLAK